MRGPGETQIETDRRIIGQKISLLKKKLEKIDKQKITQSHEYQRFCWEVSKLKQFTEKMNKREIESVCEEIEEIAPPYVLL